MPGLNIYVSQPIPGLSILPWRMEAIAEASKVSQPIPRGEAAARLWDGVLLLSGTDGFFELKHMAGGMVDIEFIAQYLMLRHAAKRPSVLAHGTDGALVALARAELLSERDFARLRGALSLWRRLHGYLRLTVGERFEEASLAPAIARRLAEIGGAVDYATLRKQISATAAAVHAIYVRIVEAQEERAS